MENSAAYYSQPTMSHARGHTSSAFSASAHGPHEDWTKISDLAERRRIQNRIAQRNYRKKLKKRLEDLEKRASTSTDESDHKTTTSKPKSTKRKDSAASSKPALSPEAVSRSSSDYSLGTSEPPQIGFLPYSDDRLFSEQYGARLSASPPPPVPLNLVSSDMLYPTYSTHSSYSSVSAGCDPALYAYQTTFDSPYPSPLSDMQFPKQDLFSEPDSLNASLGFAPMSHMDFQQLPQTPPYDCFELQTPPSPSESLAFSQAQLVFPPSPPLAMI